MQPIKKPLASISRMSQDRETVGELYSENLQLRTMLASIKRTLTGERGLTVEQQREQGIAAAEEVHVLPNSKTNCCHRHKGLIVTITIISVLVVCFTAYVLFDAKENRDFLTSVLDKNDDHSESQSPSALGLLSGDGTEDNAKYINVGVRQDYLLQECQGNVFKQTFPDIDYSFLGYNLIRGYPLSVGHDPGFTLPIFIADYSEKRQSADCRYSIPRGLLVISDVSCETSFISRVSQTRYAFTKTLSISANILGSGAGKKWSGAFSANGGYKKTTTEISTGDYVYITSSANCFYYFSKLMKRRSPNFHPLFIDWVNQLASTDDSNVYFEFFDTYGTHFPTEVVFGARYTFEHRMQSSKYYKMESEGFNVGASASYSGKFTIEGGFGMSSSKRSESEEFSKNVETKSITVGATPPANGDPMAWASNVKLSPVPVKYTLHSIENLFTNKYMAQLNVNKSRIVSNILKYKDKYCETFQDSGEVDSCERLEPGLLLEATRFLSHYRELKATYMDCVSYCEQLTYCAAITYCIHCNPQSSEYGKCFLFKTGQTAKIITCSSALWRSYVVLEKLDMYLELPGAIVKGTPRAFENPEDKKSDLQRCFSMCLQDVSCVAMTYTDSRERITACSIYSSGSVSGLTFDNVTHTYFIPPKLRHQDMKSYTINFTSSVTYGDYCR